jgi:hypothetical protein
MSGAPTVTRGCDAFECLADVFTLAGGNDCRRAIDAFVMQMKTQGAPILHEARAGAVFLHQVSLGPDGDDEMFFRVGSYGVDALSARALYRDGVLLLADRWADDLRLSLEADAPFEAVAEWPEPSS